MSFNLSAIAVRQRAVTLFAFSCWRPPAPTLLALIPLAHSAFWGSMAYTLNGGTAIGTVLILMFLPALYAAWLRIKPTADESQEMRTAMAVE